MSLLGGLPVLIVGAGPVGLSLGLALRQAGIDTRVIDHRPGIPRDHRATTLQPKTLELFARWGVLDNILRAGVRVDRLQYWDWSRRPSLLAELDYRSILGDTACPYRVHLDQFTICDILLDALERSYPGTVLWGTKALELVDQGDHVSVTAIDREQQMFVFRASVLAAADGHGSTIRERLGISISGIGESVGFISAFAPLDAYEDSHLCDVCYLYDDAGWAMLMTMPDRIRMLLPSSGDADATSAKATEVLSRRFIGPDAKDKLRSLALYRVKPGVADRLRVGRVVLVGDAAHAAYPVGGTAMNFGIHDADVLVGALCVGAEEALDYYAVSRRNLAQEHLIKRANASLQALSAHGLWSRAGRARHLHGIAESPQKSREHLLRLSMLDERI